MVWNFGKFTRVNLHHSPIIIDFLDNTRFWSHCLKSELSIEHLYPMWLEPDSNRQPRSSWVFLYELSCCGFESSCSHLKLQIWRLFRGVPWHSGNHRVRNHSETRTWHDKNIVFTSYKFFREWFSVKRSEISVNSQE